MEVGKDKTKKKRKLDKETANVSDWQSKAEQAIKAGRDDLAKAALEKKLVATKNVNDLQKVKVRKNLNETAFFYPNLILGDNGSVIFEFAVPGSLTQWQVWATAITHDLRGGSASKTTRTSKDLMVRPYLPRFLREGDQADVEVVIAWSDVQVIVFSDRLVCDDLVKLAGLAHLSE